MFVKEKQFLPHCSGLHPWPQLHSLFLQDSKVSFLPLDFDFDRVTCFGWWDVSGHEVAEGLNSTGATGLALLPSAVTTTRTFPG